jgi:hypothetical protein
VLIWGSSDDGNASDTGLNTTRLSNIAPLLAQHGVPEAARRVWGSGDAMRHASKKTVLVGSEALCPCINRQAIDFSERRQ